MYHLHRELLVPQSIDAVWPYFSDASNLEELTPASVGFHILTPQPIVMRQGTLIDYRIRLHGLPIRWQSEITVWEPRCRFVDEQRRGPYRRWVHEHRFQAMGKNTLLVDDVEYALLGGDLVHDLFVRSALGRIFDYRGVVMRERFGAVA